MRAEATMASITYQITITSDGKPAITVTSDDPQATRDAIPWLAQTYATLLKDAKAVPQPGTTIVEAQQGGASLPACGGAEHSHVTYRQVVRFYRWSG